MIRISTRGRYALRAMVDVARHAGDGPVPRQDTADRQEISADYMAQLFGRLQAAGLVQGVKGPGGGYRLARDAASISVGDVVQAVEGPVALVACTLPCPEEEPVCARVETCVTHLIWKRLSETIAEFLDSISLQEVCEEAERLEPIAEIG